MGKQYVVAWSEWDPSDRTMNCGTARGVFPSRADALRQVWAILMEEAQEDLDNGMETGPNARTLAEMRVSYSDEFFTHAERNGVAQAYAICELE